MSNAKTMFCCNTALAGIMFQRNLNNLFSYPTAQHLKSQGIPCTTDFLARFAVVSRPTTATNQTNTRGFSFRQWSHRSSPLHFACKKKQAMKKKKRGKTAPLSSANGQQTDGRTKQNPAEQQNRNVLLSGTLWGRKVYLWNVRPLPSPFQTPLATPRTNEDKARRKKSTTDRALHK